MTATQDTLIWPERLTLRDTKVFADEGQRIFTTATGYGYERQEYVIATALADRDAKIAELEKRLREIRNNAFNFQSQITELTQKLERATAVIREFVAAEDEWECEPECDRRVASAFESARAFLQTGADQNG